ncbi:MAG TPA: HAMP domain-containing sensor histidine kinase [Cyclobacteriaceae bacterium]|nr:HAMP domain-containing sensor histidine kinase [Cyclobacteriaceae bacterium]
MSKTQINIIIVLMSVACLGLIGFQLYWVSNALKINQERFEQNIYQSLTSTIEKLEKGETSDILLSALAQDTLFRASLFQRIEPIQLQVSRRRITTRPSMMDSMLTAPMPQFSQTFKRLIASKDGPTEDIEEIEKYFHMPPSVASSLFTPDEMAILLQEKERYLEHVSKQDSFARSRSHAMDRQAYIVEEYNVSRDVAESIVKANMKIELVEVVMNQLLMEGKQYILTRLDTGKARREVQSQLANRGILQSFDLGIIDEFDSLIAIGNLTRPDELRSKGIKVELFPSDLIGNDNFMIINFPHKRIFLLQQIWLPLLSSLIFLAIIIFCFVYAIKVIIRQKKLSEIKNDFINNMTHEFKTPIATVSLAVEALQDPDLANQETFRSRYLGIIKDENKRLGAQVEKVLQAATLDKKEFKLKIDKVNIVELIQSAQAHFELLVEKRGGNMQVNLSIKEPYLEGDAFHLANVINNLLDNANKYSKLAPQITIDASDTEEEVVISVKDQGIGMNKDMLKRIFDKFYRVPTGNVHDVKGFGLGLAYVKTMVEAHHGTIDVESELDKGSKFTIHLPKKHE